jgi:hypothetical protein
MTRSECRCSLAHEHRVRDHTLQLGGRAQHRLQHRWRRVARRVLPGIGRCGGTMGPVALSTATSPAPAAQHERAGVVRLLLAGLSAGLWVAVVGFGVVAAPVLLAWLGAGAAEPMADALSVAVSGWLLGFGVTLTSPGASWGLAPLGLTAVYLVLAARSASWAGEWTRARGRTHVGLLLAAAAASAAFAAGVAAAASSLDLLRADPGEAAARAGLVVALGAAAGTLRVRREHLSASLLPPSLAWLERSFRPSLAAVATLVAVAAGLLTVALVAGFGPMTDLVRQIDPGVAGALALLAVTAAYLPTVLVWVLAVIVGPGVHLGGETALSATAVVPGTLPGFPLLGAVPADVPAWLVAVGPAAFLLAGVLAGGLLARAIPAGTGLLGVAGSAVAVGLLAGAATGIACWAATGPLGPGTLREVGTVPAEAAGVVALSVGVVAAAVAGTQVTRTRRAAVEPAAVEG